MNHEFRRFANVAAAAVGSMWAFVFALAVVFAWLIGGLIFGFNEIWLLLINRVCTVVTFVMVFLIQNTQNRHSVAIQLKLDELIRGTEGPRTHMVNLENLSDAELQRLQHEFQRLRERESARMGGADANQRQ